MNPPYLHPCSLSCAVEALSRRSLFVYRAIKTPSFP